MKHTNRKSPKTVLVNAKHVEMVIKLTNRVKPWVPLPEPTPLPTTPPTHTFSISLDRHVNSLQTALLSEKLASISGFASSLGPATEWPVWESDEYLQESVDLLRKLRILEPSEDPPHITEDQGLPTVADVLGLYLSDSEIIVLFPNMIRMCADALKISYQVLYEVVLSHEIAHAVTHRCTEPGKSDTWNLFAEASPDSKELLAQLIPFTYFSRQECQSHLEVMDKLLYHQDPVYNSYKTSVDPFGSTNALPELVVKTRMDEEHRVRRLGAVEPEWNAFYQEDGEMMYSVRDTGVVFAADDLEGNMNPMAREILSYRVHPDTLHQIIEIVKNLSTLVSYDSSMDPFSHRKGGKTSLVNFRIDSNDHSTYCGKSGVGGAYTSDFLKLIVLIGQGVAEAKGETIT